MRVYARRLIPHARVDGDAAAFLSGAGQLGVTLRCLQILRHTIGRRRQGRLAMITSLRAYVTAASSAQIYSCQMVLLMTVIFLMIASATFSVPDTV